MTSDYHPCVWAMRYVDALNKRDDADEEVAEYFSQFGFDKLVVPQTLVYIVPSWERICQRFNERYYFRRIGQETMERWQIRLQNRFDEIVDEMERAYRLYATTSNIDEVTPGTKVTYGHTESNNGSSSSTGSNKVRNINTPDSAMNEDEDYADQLTKGDSSGTSSNQSLRGLSGSDRTEVLGPDVLGGVNKSIKDWKDIDTMFISRFENNFLNIFD